MAGELSIHFLSKGEIKNRAVLQKECQIQIYLPRYGQTIPSFLILSKIQNRAQYCQQEAPLLTMKPFLIYKKGNTMAGCENVKGILQKNYLLLQKCFFLAWLK